jgi:hypothetical protein
MLWQMRSGRRHLDRLGAAMLVGALIGFLAGAAVGLSAVNLTALALLPFAGAAAGVLLAGSIGLAAGWGRGRRQAVERAAEHERLRAEAHAGWIEDVDLNADPPPRPRRPLRDWELR